MNEQNEFTSNQSPAAEPLVIVPQPKNKKSLSQKQPINFLIKIGKINIYRHEQLPKFLLKPLQKRYEKFYNKQRLHLLLDVMLLAITLGAVILTTHLIVDKDFYAAVNQNLQRFINRGTAAKPRPLIIVQQLLEPASAIINQSGEITLMITAKNLNDRPLTAVQIITSLEGQNASYELVPVAAAVKETLAAGDSLSQTLDFKKIIAGGSTILIKSKINYQYEGNNYTDETEPQLIKINSQIKFSGEAKYFTAEGDQLGFGPLPPQINAPTSYWIVWRVANGANNLTETSVSGILPANVRFTGKTSVTLGQGLAYDPATRIISWPLGEVLKNETAQAGFEVELTPLADQLGKIPPLITANSITALDDYTKSAVKKSLANITTQLPDFGDNSGQAKVIP